MFQTFRPSSRVIRRGGPCNTATRGWVLRAAWHGPITLSDVFESQSLRSSSLNIRLQSSYSKRESTSYSWLAKESRRDDIALSALVSAKILRIFWVMCNLSRVSRLIPLLTAFLKIFLDHFLNCRPIRVRITKFGTDSYSCESSRIPSSPTRSCSHFDIAELQ